MKSNRWTALLTALLGSCALLRGPTDEAEATTAEPLVDPARLSGGEGTVFDASPLAFSLALRNLPTEQRRAFAVGNAFFNDNWVTAPASTSGRDGLGPFFNAPSCSSCHVRDGRGGPPESPEEELVSVLIRLSLPSDAQGQAPIPEPSYGDQLQPRAILDVPPEGSARLIWTSVEGRFDDGQGYDLRRPEIQLSELAYGPLHPDTRTSARVAPSVFGLGLVEAISDSDLQSWSDPEDSDGDGISGRVHRVWSESLGGEALGRFGWKANVASLRDQTAGAFLGDIGITSSLHPEESHTEVQTAASEVPHGGQPELDDHKLDRITLYLQTLAVPARRGLDDPSVQRGERIFGEVGCDGCHRPSFTTGSDHPVEALRGQRIQPYSDFLLHDMGEGLADGRGDFAASGTEWRTPPLWGLGLQQVVSGHELLLHDGRARGVEEAILWHGGEAQSSRDRYRSLDESQRSDLVAFLRSL